jgi:1,4-dihydroxy-2-naphthoate octaprenyltransferase
MIAGALAYKDGFFNPLILAACFGVAFFAQIASNFANDYFDYRKGADTSARVGPKRAVAAGDVTPARMLSAALIMLFAAVALGVFIASERGWGLLIIGALICAAVMAYSAGPYPLAYHGWGDICVIIFYGIVPVLFTYYAVSGGVTARAVLISFAVGVLTDNILLVNNYRDYEEDSLSGKRTTVVLFGKNFGGVFYLLNILTAFTIAFITLRRFSPWFVILYLFLFIWVLTSWKRLLGSNGSELNELLGVAGRNVFLFALLICIGVLL